MMLFLLLFALQTPSAPQPLIDAATNGDLVEVTRLVEAGADVNAANSYGVTPLAMAAWRNRIDVVKYLLEKDADVHFRDTFYNITAIQWALFKDHLEVATMLLDAGSEGAADVLRLAIRKNDLALIEKVVNHKDVDGDILIQARRTTDDAKILALLENESKPSSYQQLGLTEDLLKTYAGVYHHIERGDEIHIQHQAGALYSQDVRGRPASYMTPTSKNTFDVQGMPVVLTFNVSDSGTTINVKLPNFSFDLQPGPLPESATPSAGTETASTDAPVEALIAPRSEAINWPSFRGQNAAGAGDGQGVPVKWDVATGQNVRWKTPIAGNATASPIIWDGKVFMVTAISGKGDHSLRPGLYGDVDSVDDDSVHAFMVMAYDLNTGKELWSKEVAKEKPQIKRHLKATQANSSPVTDGKHVVSIFGTIGLLVCHDLEGKELWRTDVGVMDSGWFFDKTAQWGYSASPVIYKDTVIVQADQQQDAFIAAYSLKDGKQVWRTAREGEISTWGTPTLYFGETDEVITNGTTIRGYDAKTGKELWTLGPNSEITVGTPVTYKDLFFVTGGYSPVEPVYAIKAGSRGDLTLPEGEASSASIPWRHNGGGTYMPSPIVYRDQLYTVDNDGRVTSYNPLTGERIYRARIGGRPSLTASPVAADGRLYFVSETGDVVVAEAGPKFRELARMEMNEIMMATPAISDGFLVIRTKSHLYGIAETRASN